MIAILRCWILLLLLSLPGADAWAQEWRSAPAPQEGTELPLPPEGWTTVEGTYLRIHGDADRTELLLRLARHGSEALPRLAGQLDVPIGKTIHVYVAGTEEQFRELQPGVAPTWADATAWPRLGVVFLRDTRIRPATDEPLEVVFDHELVHVLLGRAFAPRVPPAWLQEGAAQVLAGQAGPEVARILSSSALTGGPMSVESLERSFPADPMRARLAYAVSADFVQYLQAEHGDEVLSELVGASLEGVGIRGAVRRATGTFLDEVEADWGQRWASRASVPASLLADLGEWVFVGGALLLPIGWVMRRRRFHRRLREMEEEEALIDMLVDDLRARRFATERSPTN